MPFSTPVSLLARLRERPAAENWARFVELYSPLLYTWASRLGLTEHDAADLVQDVFATLVERLPQFQYEPEKSFRAWLKTVLLNRWRQWQRRHEVAATAATLTMLRAPDELDLAEQEYRRQLTQRALAIMQADFEPTTWKACWETVVNQRAAADVAAELGMTINAVYLARSRVLRRLRGELDGLLD